jgi:hypothetical protein
LLIVFGLLVVGGALVTYGTFARNRWGVNLGDVTCPRCKTLLPQIRKPQSTRQKLWGGWKCPGCGVEIDKWGREVSGGGVERALIGSRSATHPTVKLRNWKALFPSPFSRHSFRHRFVAALITWGIPMLAAETIFSDFYHYPRYLPVVLVLAVPGTILGALFIALLEHLVYYFRSSQLGANETTGDRWS